MHIRCCLVLLGLMLSPWGAASAAEAGNLPVPTGEIILTVSGRISNTNGAGVANFDRTMLESLGMHTLHTTTTWTDGVKRFDGVLARDLLDLVGAEGQSVVATALNDYVVRIPAADFKEFDVLLAMQMDGQQLLTRDKGPIWIVYPRDEHPELQDPRYDHRWVWQLREIHFE